MTMQIVHTYTTDVDYSTKFITHAGKFDYFAPSFIEGNFKPAFTGVKVTTLAVVKFSLAHISTTSILGMFEHAKLGRPTAFDILSTFVKPTRTLIQLMRETPSLVALCTPWIDPESRDALVPSVCLDFCVFPPKRNFNVDLLPIFASWTNYLFLAVVSRK